MSSSSLLAGVESNLLKRWWSFRSSLLEFVVEIVDSSVCSGICKMFSVFVCEP